MGLCFPKAATKAETSVKLSRPSPVRSAGQVGAAVLSWTESGCDQTASGTPSLLKSPVATLFVKGTAPWKTTSAASNWPLPAPLNQIVWPCCG